jgi:hypothetical protein
MPPPEPIPGTGGIIFLVTGSIVVSLLITIMTQTWAHWLALGLALLVAWWAIAAINGR